MLKVQEELEALRQRVSQGQSKASEKIGAAAGRVLSRPHGYRYYSWELKQGQFHYFEHTQNLQQEKAVEGKYLIQSEESRTPNRRLRTTDCATAEIILARFALSSPTTHPGFDTIGAIAGLSPALDAADWTLWWCGGTCCVPI